MNSVTIQSPAHTFNQSTLLALFNFTYYTTYIFFICLLLCNILYSFNNCIFRTQTIDTVNFIIAYRYLLH